MTALKYLSVKSQNKFQKTSKSMCTLTYLIYKQEFENTSFQSNQFSAMQ